MLFKRAYSLLPELADGSTECDIRSLYRELGAEAMKENAETQEMEAHRQLVAGFWAHQAWWQSGSGKDENDDYQPMHEFGYAIAQSK